MILTEKGEIIRVDEAGEGETKVSLMLGTLFDSRVKDIRAGHAFCLALTEKNHIYSFGVGQSGTLGLGVNTTVQLKPKKIIVNDKPLEFMAIETGPNHCAAINLSRKVLTWGYGGDGRLGTGDPEPLFVPKLIDQLDNENIVQITCGTDYTLFLNEEGNVFGCGSLKYGKLGIVFSAEDEAFISIPRPIGTKNKAFQSIVEIKAGSNHTLALSFDDQKVNEIPHPQIFSFGTENSGVLGRPKNNEIIIVGIPYLIPNYYFYCPDELKSKHIQIATLFEAMLDVDVNSVLNRSIIDKEIM